MAYFGLRIGNGWMLTVMYLTIMYIPIIFSRTGTKRAVNYSFLSTRGRVISVILSLITIILLGYPIFREIYLGSGFFMTGVVLFLLSAFGLIASYISYFSTPLEEAIRKGTYKFSRNPMGVCFTGMVLGMALMLHSCFMVVLLMVYNIFGHFVILEEEHFCKETYGDTYREYFQKVPRYILF